MPRITPGQAPDRPGGTERGKSPVFPYFCFPEPVRSEDVSAIRGGDTGFPLFPGNGSGRLSARSCTGISPVRVANYRHAVFIPADNLPRDLPGATCTPVVAVVLGVFLWRSETIPVFRYGNKTLIPCCRVKDGLAGSSRGRPPVLPAALRVYREKKGGQCLRGLSPGTVPLLRPGRCRRQQMSSSHVRTGCPCP